jgi:hypothetical protein
VELLESLSHKLFLFFSSSLPTTLSEKYNQREGKNKNENKNKKRKWKKTKKNQDQLLKFHSFEIPAEENGSKE